MKILLAKPRGFCAGVDRAVDVVELALQLYPHPIYVKHEIVHNRTVVDDLQRKGAVFVETVQEIPEGAVTIFSAHGSPPSDYQEASARKLNVIDATCPLVTKVHLEARRYSKESYTIILIGHRGHVEVAGTIGEAPGKVILIENVEEARTVEVPDPEKVAVLTQTTLNIDDTKEIMAALKERFPKLVTPKSEDICYATRNRQAAVKQMAKSCQVILVIGSKNSSNSNRLREVGEEYGARSYLIDRASDINPQWIEHTKTVGVTAGASAPETVVQEVIQWLLARGGSSVKEVEAIREEIRFPLPQDLIKEATRQGKDLEQLQKHAIQAGMRMRV